jgi:hypothetical protein
LSHIATCRHLPVSQWSEAALREEAQGYAHDNYAPGEDGYCNPKQANWQYVDKFELEQLAHLMGDASEWKAWLDAELAMDRDDELHRDWDRLLVEPIEEEVVILVRDDKGYIWDGWHRVAASIVSGRTTIKAIVGQPV